MSDEKYVQDFTSGDDEKTGLEKRVMNCKDLSADDKLKIIRAIEKSGDSIFGDNTPNIYNNPIKPITQQFWWGNLQAEANNNTSDPNQPILYKTSKTVKFDAEDLFTSTANMQQNKSCDKNGDTEQWYIAKNI